MLVISEGIWPWLHDVASLAPLGTFAAAVVAAIALRQKYTTDRRQAWWERLQWATDTLLSGDPHGRRIGGAALKAVSTFKLRTDEDRIMLKAIASNQQSDAIGELPSGPTGPHADVDVAGKARDDGTNERGAHDGLG